MSKHIEKLIAAAQWAAENLPSRPETCKAEIAAAQLGLNGTDIVKCGLWANHEGPHKAWGRSWIE